MDPHPEFRSTTALASMSRVSGTTLATQEIAYSTSFAERNAKWEVTVRKVSLSLRLSI